VENSEGLMRNTIYAGDLFCGAGGSSTGLLRACGAMGKQLDLLAVNHWAVAVETHSTNHPKFRHLCESLDNVNPRTAVPRGRLDILLASPECIFHSRARGGRPINDQARASAWHVVRWAEALRIESILIENVREFREWGPLNAYGRPIKSRKGEIYRAFLNSLRAIGYTVEDQLLNAADFGDPTTRQRLFIQARRGRKPIVWPTPSHNPTGLLGAKWRAAREIIDWTIKGQSIFERKRPLAEKTMERILAGLQKFGGPELAPYLVILRQHADARSLKKPLPTICAGGNHLGVAEPFLVPFFGERNGQKPRTHSIDEPLPAVTSHGAGALVQPFILPHRMFDRMDVDSVDDPLRTITAKGAGDFALVEPFILPQQRFGRMDADSVDKPMRTLTASGARVFALVEPFIVPIDNGSNGDGTKHIEDPLGTITTKARFGVAEPFLTKYYATAKGAQPVTEPLDTVTTKDRFALVEPEVRGSRLDIRFRMLQPHELAGATGFDRDYIFAGTREDQVRQIGNAVPVNTATALCRAILEAA
jgi:DNA (cytosine-5)-methyltransferase 1